MQDFHSADNFPAAPSRWRKWRARIFGVVGALLVLAACGVPVGAFLISLFNF